MPNLLCARGRARCVVPFFGCENLHAYSGQETRTMKEDGSADAGEQVFVGSKLRHQYAALFVHRTRCGLAVSLRKAEANLRYPRSACIRSARCRCARRFQRNSGVRQADRTDQCTLWSGRICLAHHCVWMRLYVGGEDFFLVGSACWFDECLHLALVGELSESPIHWAQQGEVRCMSTRHHARRRMVRPVDAKR